MNDDVKCKTCGDLGGIPAGRRGFKWCPDCVHLRKPKRRYGIVDGQRVLIKRFKGCDGFEVKWTSSCSGCFESEDGHPVGDHPRHPKHNCYIGAGCHECGYRGVRRQVAWVPMDYDAERYFKAVCK